MAKVRRCRCFASLSKQTNKWAFIRNRENFSLDNFKNLWQKYSSSLLSMEKKGQRIPTKDEHRMNMVALQRIDPFIVEILQSSSQASTHIYHVADQKNAY